MAKLTKPLSIFLCCAVLFFGTVFSSPPVFGQAAQSNCVITKVGNPIGQPVLPPGCTAGGAVTGSCGSVVDWDAKIMAVLQDSGSGYNYLSAPVSSTCYTATTGAFYWCTLSIIDSYRLAGIDGLNRGMTFVIQVHNYWMSAAGTAAGYKYVEYELANKIQALQNVYPGYAMFMERVRLVQTFDGNEHVALVREIKVDPTTGNGYIKTYESNGGIKDVTYPVSGGDIIGVTWPVRGFGGH